MRRFEPTTSYPHLHFLLINVIIQSHNSCQHSSQITSKQKDHGWISFLTITKEISDHLYFCPPVCLFVSSIRLIYMLPVEYLPLYLLGGFDWQFCFFVCQADRVSLLGYLPICKKGDVKTVEKYSNASILSPMISIHILKTIHSFG